MDAIDEAFVVKDESNLEDSEFKESNVNMIRNEAGIFKLDFNEFKDKNIKLVC